MGWVDIKDFLSDADRFKQGKVRARKKIIYIVRVQWETRGRRGGREGRAVGVCGEWTNCRDHTERGYEVLYVLAILCLTLCFGEVIYGCLQLHNVVRAVSWACDVYVAVM